MNLQAKNNRAWPLLLLLLVLLSVFLAGIVMSTTALAQAITFRSAASSASTSTPITFVAAGAQVSGGAVASITPVIPAGTQAGDFAVLIVGGRPTDATNPGAPAGWTLRSSSLREVGVNDLNILTFYRVLAGGDANPVVSLPATWQGAAAGMSGQIAVWRGVDRVNPFDTTDVTGNSAAVRNWIPPQITTVTPGAWVVTTVATSDDNALAFAAGLGQGFTLRMSGIAYDTALGGDHAIGLADLLQAAAGTPTMPTWRQTVNNNDLWASITFALRPALTIDKPAGTVPDDVMIASIAAQPQTVTITPPTGWTLVRRVDNATSSLATYRKLAGASEPARYTWAISASTGAAGGIQSFANVDTANPIDVENGQSTPSSTSHATPDVTTTVPDTMLVTSHAYGSSGTWTPTGMTEAFDVASLTPDNAAGISIAGNYLTQAAAAATGAKTATATAAADVGNAHILALRPRVHHFVVSVVGGAAANTCVAKNIIITAQDVSNNTVTNYTGTINITTSSAHGDWSVITANGTLTNGTVDDGAATYSFVATDSGVITLALTNIHADDLTVTVQDSIRPSTASSSIAINFSGNAFAIANDTIQVAGRNQAMTVTMNGSASCTNPLAGYTGSKSLKAWLTLDADDPGGTRPSIVGMSSPPLGTAAPASDNLTLSFSNGSASFSLSSVDVGKYQVHLRDDSGTFAGTPSTPIPINGTSLIITTQPFALVVSGIKKGATDNPAGNATSGSKFIVAADTFQATVGAYLWSTTADTTPADGSPDAAATLAQITAAGATPSYRWATVLAAASPFTPAAADGGTLGTLGNGTQTGACPTGAPNCFSSGIATPTNLSYDEVGSFTLTGSASNFLNSGVNLTALVFDNQATPARNAVVGRFYPDHFTLLAGSSITPYCGSGATGFTYMGQPNLGYSFAIEARNLANAKTSNYLSTYYGVGTVSMLAENNNDGTDLSARLPATAGSWATGTYTYSPTTAIFSRPASPDGPFDLLRIGVTVADADGAVLASRDMDPVTNTDCTIVPTCTGRQIGGTTTKLRFGRLRLLNAYGSELLPIRAPVRAEYFNGTTWALNAADSCTSLAANAIALSGGISANTSASAVALSGGSGTLILAKPSPVATGSVDVAANLGMTGTTADVSCNTTHPATTAANIPWLQFPWCTGKLDPNARIKFGSPKAPYIYLRERY